MESFLRSFLNHPYEICGHFTESQGVTSIHGVIHRGPNAHLTRGVCHYPEMPRSKFFFHTHPSISYPIPSVEDLLFVVNRSVRLKSIVVTRLGIFTLTNITTPHTKRQVYNSHKKLNQTLRTRLSSKLQPLVDSAVSSTKNKLHLTPKKQIALTQFCTKCNVVLSHLATVHFKPW